MPKTSFARPGSPSAPSTKAPLPPPRPGTSPQGSGAPKPNVTTATTAAAPRPPAPPKPAPVAEAPAVEVETEVVDETPAPTPPKPRGRPAGAPNKPKAPTPSTALAVAGTETGRLVVFTGQAGKIEGDFDSSDLTLPQFKCASGAGPLKLLDDPIIDGCLVVGAVDQWTYVYADQWEPTGVTIVKARKGFVQKKNEDGGNLYELDEQGLMCDTIEELKALGGSLQDVKGMKVFEAVLNAHVLIRLPDGAEDPMGLFDLEIEGNRYAQAIWRIRGSSYRECAKKIYDESKEGRFLGPVSYSGEFLATSKYIKSEKNAWYIPKLENGEAHTEAFMEVAAAL